MGTSADVHTLSGEVFYRPEELGINLSCQLDRNLRQPIKRTHDGIHFGIRLLDVYAKSN